MLCFCSQGSFLDPGDYFGEQSLVGEGDIGNHAVRTATVRAVMDTELLYITKERWNELLGTCLPVTSTFILLCSGVM